MHFSTEEFNLIGILQDAEVLAEYHITAITMNAEVQETPADIPIMDAL